VSRTEHYARSFTPLRFLRMKHADRVKAHTAARINRQIEDSARNRVLNTASRGESAVSSRIMALENEWDIERVLEMNASALTFVGALLAVTVSRRFLAIPLVVSAFLLLHATEGWCPPVPALRRLGIRTRKEIDREKFALKALRGDFAQISTSRDGHDTLYSASQAWAAARY
jgi:hypothetical protein